MVMKKSFIHRAPFIYVAVSPFSCTLNETHHKGHCIAIQHPTWFNTCTINPYESFQRNTTHRKLICKDCIQFDSVHGSSYSSVHVSHTVQFTFPTQYFVIPTGPNTTVPTHAPLRDFVITRSSTAASSRVCAFVCVCVGV